MLQDLTRILSGSSQESLFSFTTFLPTIEGNHSPVPVSPTDHTLPSSPMSQPDSDPLLNVSKAFDDVRSKLLCAVNTADTADPKELEDDTF
jgi:hypothetical protein